MGLLRERRYQALAAITLLAAVARFATLDVQSFWHDEAVTVNRILQAGLWDTLDSIPGNESTPPLYYLLAWFWVQPFGEGEVGLRSLSALLGTLTVPVIYAGCARLATPRVGLVAAALAAVDPLFVWYSQEARAYALLVLLVALSFLFFARAREGGGGRDLAWWAIASAAALATHYFAIFVVVPEAVLLLAVVGAERRRQAIAAVGGVAAAGLALLPLAVHQSGSANNDWFADIALSTRVTDTAKAFLIGEPQAQVSRALAAVIVVVAVALVLLVLRSDARERKAALIGAAVGGAALAVPLVLALGGADFFVYRNVIIAMVPLFAVTAAGLGARRAGWFGLAATAAGCAVSIALLVTVARDEELQRADWRTAAEALGPATGPRAVVTAFLGDDPLEVYRPGTRRFPRGGASVGEVDVIAYSRPSREPPAPGFRLVEQRRVERFTLLRFKADEPRKLRPGQLRARRIGAERNAVLLVPADR